MKSKCGGISFQSASNNKQIDPQEVAFTENYDIATYRFKSIVDEDVANVTATSEDINEAHRFPFFSEEKLALLRFRLGPSIFHKNRTISLLSCEF